jgi:high-affinity nickel-transport protein
MLAELAGLAGVALVLGIRHGLDADHLATVDALTRTHAQRGSGRAESSGLLFSAGHGIAVIAAATTIAALGQRAASPAWLQGSGSYIAVSALITLGSFNLWAALRASPGRSHSPISIKRWLALRLGGHLGGPFGIMGLGGLFAVSFDALAVATLFAASANALGTVWVASALGAIFALGMSTVDGLAGWGSAWMLRRSHALAPGASRISGLVVSFGCFATSAAVLVEPLLTGAAGFSESQALVLSACVGLLVPLTYGATWWFIYNQGRTNPITPEEQ